MASSTTFTTPKGTRLPLLDLRGKDYLQVAHRLVWFREDHPDWSIETEPLTIQQDYAVFRAQVKDEHGRVIATGTKHESKLGFFDFIEKAETGAIGRALALCGYGTQFAPELDEGERIVDSPLPPVRDARGNGGVRQTDDAAIGTFRNREFPNPGNPGPAAGGGGPARNFGRGESATMKQVQFVTDLAVRKLGARMGDRNDIFAKLGERFGVRLEGPGDLSKSAARNFIDQLQALPDVPPAPPAFEEDDEGMLGFDETA